ncbi:hypothetical protein [Spiroplasma endosymbiont of Dilophus febrilis]|uniref:hypothetical protein n=1 Tax=Spiroplasma endosymbiont of Dilophus febrilis TaxID=3066292 RepID=UPI00313C38C2
MKKSLAILGTITIAATALPTVIAASPCEKKEQQIKLENIEINYLQTKDLKKLNRGKRNNENRLRNKYRAAGHNYLFAKIGHTTWQNIVFNHNSLKDNDEFYNFVFSKINEFPKQNNSGDFVASDYFWQDDTEIIAHIIVDKFDDINNVFKGKNDIHSGIILRTNRASYWDNNHYWWGAHINNYEHDVWE